jgi:hypothetical protein
MGNGYGPLFCEDHLNRIRYEDREYQLGSSYSSSESYIEISGLDPNQLAGPWGGGPEIDCEAGRVTLPTEVAFKVAAAILRSNVGRPRWDGEPCWICDHGSDHQTVIKLLDGILSHDPANTTAPQRGTTHDQ